MKKLLWIGDCGCPSGFARATHEILEVVHHDYDVTVLGINYRGDPTGYPEFLVGRIYAAATEGDAVGIGRLSWMCDLVKPDIIVIQQDGWYIPYFMHALRTRKPSGEYYRPDHAAIPVVVSLAVDGKNFRGDWIEGVSSAVFWTQFALDEARAGGYIGPANVIPLGVDLKTYYPVNRQEALERLKIGMLKDMFIVGNVNRNQPRKRWDLTIRYFAEWVRSRHINDAQLFLHCAPTGDSGVDVMQLSRYYGVFHQIAFRNPEPFYGISESEMRDTYNCFDVNISTSQGEGFGLTTIEAMACGVPCIVPEWSALGDWANGAAAMVSCTSTALNPVSPGLNVIGGVPDEEKFIEVLDKLYHSKDERKFLACEGLSRVSEPRFRWSNIGDAWVMALDRVLAPQSIDEEVWKDLGRPQESIVPPNCIEEGCEAGP